MTFTTAISTFTVLFWTSFDLFERVAGSGASNIIPNNWMIAHNVADFHLLWGRASPVCMISESSERLSAFWLLSARNLARGYGDGDDLVQQLTAIIEHACMSAQSKNLLSSEGSFGKVEICLGIYYENQNHRGFPLKDCQRLIFFEAKAEPRTGRQQSSKRVLYRKAPLGKL